MCKQFLRGELVCGKSVFGTKYHLGMILNHFPSLLMPSLEERYNTDPQGLCFS